MEKLEDFNFEGQKVLASRLGYRITAKFARTFLGRIFENPDAIFDQEILKPETQDLAVFVDGINNIVDTQQQIAESYFKDGSVEGAIPPLKALLHIMAYGEYNGKDINHPDIRNLFLRDNMLDSEWYHQRLKNKQKSDIGLWQKHLKYLKNYRELRPNIEQSVLNKVNFNIDIAEKTIKRYQSSNYLKSLEGFIGLDSFVV